MPSLDAIPMFPSCVVQTEISYQIININVSSVDARYSPTRIPYKILPSYRMELFILCLIKSRESPAMIPRSWSMLRRRRVLDWFSDGSGGSKDVAKSEESVASPTFTSTQIFIFKVFMVFLIPKHLSRSCKTALVTSWGEAMGYSLRKAAMSVTDVLGHWHPTLVSKSVLSFSDQVTNRLLVIR
jgi:hypothetical protein